MFNNENYKSTRNLETYFMRNLAVWIERFHLTATSANTHHIHPFSMYCL